MKRIKTLLGTNPLIKNSLYLMISNGILAAGGFLFWIIIARLYPAYEIGIATSIIALISLISTFALLGLNTGIIKFLPSSDNKNLLINTVISLVFLASILISLLVAASIPFFSKPLEFVFSSRYYFTAVVIFTAFTALNLLVETILIAFRSSKYVLIKNIIMALVKLLFPFILIGLAGLGILVSYFGGTVAAVLLAFYILYKKHDISYGLKISSLEVKKMMAVSLGTYISGLMVSAPLYVLPIMITNVLGPTQTAFYYIVTTTTNVLNLVPLVISQNLLVEGSYDESRIEHLLRRSIQLSLAILVPFIIFIYLFGNYILLAFGKQYSAEGISLLYFLSTASILVGFNYILGVLMVVYNRIKYLIICNGLYAVVLFGLSYLFLTLGIIGVGYATIFAQVSLLVFYLSALFKMRKLHLLKSVYKIKDLKISL